MSPVATGKELVAPRVSAFSIHNAPGALYQNTRRGVVA
jgi:hypothetical protein